MRAIVITGFAMALLISGTGCTASPEPEQQKPATAVQEAPSETGTTLKELQEMYVAAGGQCATITPRVMQKVAKDAGDCDGGALLSVYQSEAQRDTAIGVLNALQESNPSPHVIAMGTDWIVNGSDAGSFASEMGGTQKQIGVPAPEVEAASDLSTDAGICAADAEMTNLELNDALAPLLGFPAGRDSRTSEQDEAIRAHKNAAMMRECPARAS